MLRLLCKAVLLSLPFPSPSLAAENSDATCTAGSGRCGTSAGSYYWPTQKGTASRTGFSPYPVPDLGKQPTWSWSDPHEDTIRATPLVDDKLNVYLSTVAGRIYKFDPDGLMLWKREMPFGTQVVGCLYDGKFITATKAGLVVAIDMESGADRWQAPVSPINVTQGDTASMLAYDGLVISATHSARGENGGGGNSDVVAIRAEDGAMVWRYLPEVHTFNFQASTPGDGTIVFQDRGGGLYRLNATDGHEIWKSGKRGAPWNESFTTGAAVCHEGRVFVVSNTGSSPLHPDTGFLHVYRLEDGAALWEHRLMYSANQAVAIGPHPTRKGKSIAVLGMGTNPGMPAAAIASQIEPWLPLGFVHFVDLFFGWVFIKNPAAMAAYDTETGARLWHHELPPFRKFATKGDSERLLRRHTDIASNNKHNDLLCLPDSCSQPVIGPDGTSYTGWQDGRIYAIRDANGDGKIDDGEVVFHEFTDGFQGSMGMAPGLFAAAPCGGGLYVWRS